MRDKLYRSKEQQLMSGVCSGFGEYFDIDVTIVRIIWIILSLINGIGIVVYIIAAVIIPEKNEVKQKSNNVEKNLEVKKKDEITNEINSNDAPKDIEENHENTDEIEKSHESIDENTESNIESNIEEKEIDVEEIQQNNNESIEKLNTDNKKMVLGIIITFIGIYMLLKQYLFWLDIKYVWAFILIFIGMILIFGNSKH